jgi:hypothetical protein
MCFAYLPPQVHQSKSGGGRPKPQSVEKQSYVAYAAGETTDQQHPPSRRSWSTAIVMGCFGRSSSKSDAEESKRRKEANKKINQQIQKDKQVYRATHRLLLLGIFRSLLVFFPRTFQPFFFYLFFAAPNALTTFTNDFVMIVLFRSRRVGQKHHSQTNEDSPC